ncbi:DUF6318 family protein [Actinotalea sp. JY-7885]|uniref:DUF6318 family protein n=1 Tax=Actinotalea sp. JY-7885 TaxID=2758576 RepID=UPI00165E7385|nr:DUF6318 family protein [Actinotalea sp. JY-7885]
MRLSRGTAALLVALCAVGGLTGCTDRSPEPTPTPTPTATSGPTPTPTTPPEATAPDRPSATHEISTEGAGAFAAYFLELYPYVYATGDLTEWRGLSHPECIFCASVITNVEEQVATGGRSEGGGNTFIDISAVDISPELYAVTVTTEQAASREFDAAGMTVDESLGGRYQLYVVLVPTPTGWQVRGIDVLDGPAE